MLSDELPKCEAKHVKKKRKERNPTEKMMKEESEWMDQLFGTDNESDDDIVNIGSSDDYDSLPNPVNLRCKMPPYQHDPPLVGPNPELVHPDVAPRDFDPLREPGRRTAEFR